MTRILVVKTSSLGDIVHALPVVDDIHRARPGALVDWVAEEALVELPRMHVGVHRSIPVALRRWRRSLWAGDTRGDIARFDAAIIDVMLGGASTLDFAQRLQARELPFIFSTGYADNQDIVRLFPGVAVVGKPYSGEALISAVAKACRRSDGQRPAVGPPR